MNYYINESVIDEIFDVYIWTLIFAILLNNSNFLLNNKIWIGVRSEKLGKNNRKISSKLLSLFSCLMKDISKNFEFPVCIFIDLSIDNNLFSYEYKWCISER